MKYASVVRSGDGEFVLLPEEFRLKADHVEIFRRGREIVLREVTLNAAAVFDVLAELSHDPLDGWLGGASPQERESF